MIDKWVQSYSQIILVKQLVLPTSEIIFYEVNIYTNYSVSLNIY